MTRNRILIFHSGSLGDTLVVVPALAAIRAHFADAELYLLSASPSSGRFVQPSAILLGSTLVDCHLEYPFQDGRMRLRALSSLIRRLRGFRFAEVVYLTRPGRRPASVLRDRVFFALCGIRRFVGAPFPNDRPGGSPLPTLPSVTQQLLDRLRAGGIATPVSAGRVDHMLGIGAPEEREVQSWLQECAREGRPPRGRWVGVVPGSNMPAKVWPPERFAAVIGRLISEFDCWPVVFGGREDIGVAETLVRGWGRGSVAAGRLTVRGGIAALGRCVVCVANDTGTIHMAAAAGVPCVGLYSARDYPGLWYPAGGNHVIFRVNIACEGCMLVRCEAQQMACVLGIQTNAVADAAVRLMASALAEKTALQTST